jgi:hypothetical protein
MKTFWAWFKWPIMWPTLVVLLALYVVYKIVVWTK